MQHNQLLHNQLVEQQYNAHHLQHYAQNVAQNIQNMMLIPERLWQSRDDCPGGTQSDNSQLKPSTSTFNLQQPSHHLPQLSIFGDSTQQQSMSFTPHLQQQSSDNSNKF